MSSRNDTELFADKAGETAVNENLGVGGRHQLSKTRTKRLAASRRREVLVVVEFSIDCHKCLEAGDNCRA